MQAVHLRKYGEATNINFELYEVDGVDFRVDAVHASGDASIMKDNGTEANTASGFVDEGNGYSLALSATELQAARLVIYLVDQTATKVWLDKSIVIETYGHASAQHAFDLDTASAAQTADHTAGIADIPTVSEFNARTVTAATYATASALSTVDGVVDTILVDTADLQANQGNWLTATGFATSGALATVDTNVDAILVDTGTTIPAQITGLNDLSAAQVNTECDTAITDAALATAADLATVDTNVDSILTDTGTAGVVIAAAQTVATVTDVTNRVTANTDQIAGSAAAATGLSKSALAVVSGEAAAGTLSTTAMTTDLTEATDDHYIGRIIVWTSGVLANQATDITDYIGLTKRLDFTATTEAPSAGDTFVIV